MSVAPSGDQRVDGLLSGFAWSGGIVRYSDPDHPSDYGGAFSDFDGDGRSAQFDGFRPLSLAQRLTAQLALESDLFGPGRAGFGVEGFTGLGVAYAGLGSGAAEIRLANSADARTAYAYSPGPGVGGDVWFGAGGRAPRAGNADHLTVLHEIGHALGLKHPHDTGSFGAVPAAWDTVEFTVMSYRSYLGAPLGVYLFEPWGAPQSYMMLDIAALQQLYGPDYSVNAGNTVYRWSPGSGRTLVDGAIGIDPGADRIFATIWDGGGRDVYDLSAYVTGVSVDLRPGGYSVFSAAQLADLGGGPNGGHARGNIFNALLCGGDPRSMIEVAVGGAGHDRLVGNAAANSLCGNGGNDRLYGGPGADGLYGGPGADRFVYARAAESAPGACDRLVAPAGRTAFDNPGSGPGDLIELAAIDADELLPGNQAFVFGSTPGRGRLWLQEAGGVTYVNGGTDADAAIEFRLAIFDGPVPVSAYGADDFLL